MSKKILILFNLVLLPINLSMASAKTVTDTPEDDFRQAGPPSNDPAFLEKWSLFHLKWNQSTPAQVDQALRYRSWRCHYLAYDGKSQVNKLEIKAGPRADQVDVVGHLFTASNDGLVFSFMKTLNGIDDITGEHRTYDVTYTYTIRKTQNGSLMVGYTRSWENSGYSFDAFQICGPF